MPALQSKISRREDWVTKLRAADCTDASEARSHSRKVIFGAERVADLAAVFAVEMTVSAALVLRPVKKMCAGWCLAKAMTLSLPRPPVPGTGELAFSGPIRGNKH